MKNEMNSTIESLITKYFDGKITSQDQNSVKFEVTGVKEEHITKAFVKLYKESFSYGYVITLKKENNIFYLYAIKKASKTNIPMVVILATITLISVYVSGLVFNTYNKSFAWTPLAYLVSLIVPLLLHETGHWVTMRRYKVPASPPYLLPAPPLQFGFLGTFGAVINMEWLPPTNDILALTGIMGPLVGFMAAIPFAILGLKYSILIPQYAAPSSSTISLVPLIVSILTYVEKIPQEYIIQPSAMMFASYIVFFVTFLNLIPVSQLDGGHVLRAALGEKGHKIVSEVFILGLIIAGFWYDTFTVFGVFALFLFLLSRGRHPGSAMGDDKLSKIGFLSVILYSILLILTLPLPV
ncbi:site-2 protease family protein [Caldisphaera sp.]|uniref:site-2 protease family protein n=1 Tax=Caldisphaera sp. TaxID=2060322 RepID=UPI0025C1AF53|nr:site-2 protease family protein [Caldisphaera sp.]